MLVRILRIRNDCPNCPKPLQQIEEFTLNTNSNMICSGLSDSGSQTATPPPSADQNWGLTCSTLTQGMPQNATDCDYFIKEMWCEKDCALIFKILDAAHNAKPKDFDWPKDVCTSNCYFTMYHDYLQRMDDGICERKLNASFWPPTPYVPKGFLAGGLPTRNDALLTPFAEMICIFKRIM